MDATTLVGVALDYLVSCCAQALVAGNPFPRNIHSILEARTWAISGKTEITLRQSNRLVQTRPSVNRNREKASIR